MAVWHQAGCCCGGGGEIEPCTDCAGEQPTIPQANVSVYGSCLDDFCYTADDGDYTWQDFDTDTNYCYWRWRGPLVSGNIYWWLEIRYYTTDGHYEAMLGRGTNSPTEEYYVNTNITTIQCESDGNLSGSFTVNGNLNPCIGCSVDITLGG